MLEHTSKTINKSINQTIKLRKVKPSKPNVSDCAGNMVPRSMAQSNNLIARDISTATLTTIRVTFWLIVRLIVRLSVRPDRLPFSASFACL